MSFYVIFIISRELCTFKANSLQFRIKWIKCKANLHISMIVLQAYTHYIRTEQTTKIYSRTSGCKHSCSSCTDGSSCASVKLAENFRQFSICVRVIHSRLSRVLTSENVYAVSRNATKCRRWNAVDNGHTKRDRKIARYTHQCASILSSLPVASTETPIMNEITWDV